MLTYAAYVCVGPFLSQANTRIAVFVSFPGLLDETCVVFRGTIVGTIRPTIPMQHKEGTLILHNSLTSTVQYLYIIYMHVFVHKYTCFS